MSTQNQIEISRKWLNTLKLTENGLDLNTESKYIGYKGGRGGGKSHMIGTLIKDICQARPTKVICLREIQRSVKDSVFGLLEDKCINEGYGWKVTDKEIVHENGSYITFWGMRGGSKQETKTRAKSIEGFDLAWIEEAQACSEESLDLFFPSIRKPGSKIIATWNPYLPIDPIQDKIGGSKFGKVEEILYYDNPMLDQMEIDLAEEMKVKNPKKFDHIYMGKPANLEGLVYGDFEYTTNVIPHTEAEKLARKADSHIIGLDWGYQHPMAMVSIYRAGEKYIITDEYHKAKQVINIKWLFDDFYRFSRGCKEIICDSARPELIEYCDEGYKQDVNERHESRFYPCEKYPGSVRDEIDTINKLLMEERLLISDNCIQLIKEIMSWLWKENAKKEVPDELGEDTCRAMGYGIRSVERGRGEVNVI